MSFDPAVLLYFRLKRPHLPRGLGVSLPHRAPYPLRQCIGMAAPHFLAIEQAALRRPHVARLGCARALPAAVWTVTAPAAARRLLRQGHAVIFEGFHPDSLARMY
jgi:hypothetical protein